MKRVLTIATMVSLGVLSSLNAGGTAASTAINNTATLDYTVDDVSQAQLSASDAGFVVDRKIDLSIANQDAGKTVNVVPSAVDQILSYDIVNTGNDTDTYALSAIQADGSNGATDDFDPVDGSCKIYDGSTEISSITLASDETKSITVKCSIPDSATVEDTQEASVWLLAEITGRTKANDEVDDPTAVQDVYADGASAAGLSSDGAFDGKHSDMGTYHVSTAALSILKTSILITDPVVEASGGSEPHRIPGATMRYCFTVDNTGSASATGVTITDNMSLDGKENLTYVKSGMVIQDIATACDCAAITDESGVQNGDDASISLDTLTGSDTSETSRACAYIETTIN